MPTYKFRNNHGDLITVTAESEPEARNAAMTAHHGKAPQTIGDPPCHIGVGGWKGEGLTLVSMED